MKKQYFLIGLIFLIALISLSNVNALSTANVLDYWTFDQNTGVYANNSVLGRTSAYLNASTWGLGIINSGVVTNTSKIVQLNTTYPNIHKTGNYSISAWIYPKSNGTMMTIFSNEETGTPKGIVFVVEDSNKTGIIVLNAPATWNWYTSVGKVNINSWNHVVLIQKGSSTSFELWINGINQSLSTTANTLGANDYLSINKATIGSRAYDFSASNFIGNIDEFAIFNKSINSTEVAELYNNKSLQYLFTISYLSFVNPTPSNNSIQFYTNNSFIINTTVENMGSTVNTTKYIYYVNGTLFNSVLNTSLNSSDIFSNLPVGQFYFNATARNSTNTSITETRLITIYNITLNITNPLNTTQATRYMNITYTNATITANITSVNRYNISLLNNDTSFNRTIIANNSLNNNYYWDVYSQNLSLLDYYVQVCAIDNLNQQSCDIEPFTLTRNALLNVTAYNHTGSQLTLFNITIDGIFYTSSSGNVTLDVILGQSYAVAWTNNSLYTYAYNLTNISSFITSANVTLYPRNSLNLTIKDSVTQSLITQNLTIVVTNSLTNTFYTATGNILLLNLEVGDNEIKIYNVNYSEARYTVNVVDFSYNLLTAYLFLGSAVSNVTFTVYNTNGAIVENAYVSQSVLTNSSYLLTMDGYTVISGKVYFSYNPNYYYLYNISHPDYVPYSFVLQPPKDDNYDITLTDITGDISYSALNISSSHTFNNVSKVINFSYVSGESSLIYEFWVYNNGVRICFNSSLLSSNSFTCNASSYEGLVYIYGVNNNIMFYGAIESLPKTSLSDYIPLSEASFWSGIIFLLIAISGAAWGIVISIIISIVAVAIILWLGLFSPLSITILAILIIMGLIIALVVRRAR